MSEKTVSTRVYNGLLSLHSYGEASDILFLSGVHDPLADELSWMSGKNVTVRYWITDAPCTKEQAQVDFLETMSGKATTDFGAAYSDMTGYLWTDEELHVGGHDLLQRLKSSVGKWLILEIEA